MEGKGEGRGVGRRAGGEEKREDKSQVVSSSGHASWSLISWKQNDPVAFPMRCYGNEPGKDLIPGSRWRHGGSVGREEMMLSPCGKLPRSFPRKCPGWLLLEQRGQNRPWGGHWDGPGVAVAGILVACSVSFSLGAPSCSLSPQTDYSP